MYTSTSNINEAKKIANGLVTSKLAACVNIIPQVVSIFEWNNKIDSSDEVLLMIKVNFFLF
jgi:periplasmic divalent cation tolerance protein